MARVVKRKIDHIADLKKMEEEDEGKIDEKTRKEIMKGEYNFKKNFPSMFFKGLTGDKDIN